MGRHLHETAFLIVTALFIPVQSRAQSPGQVSGAEAWLKTVPLTTDLQGYYHWRDFSGDSVRTNLYDAKGAAYGGEFTQRHTWIRTFNFNPALNFSEGNQPKESLLKYSNLAQMTVIGVFAPTTTAYNKDEVLYAVSGRKGAGSLVSRDKAVGQQGIEPLDYGSTAGEDLLYSGSERQTAEEFKSTSPRIVSYIRAYAPVHSVWGEGRRATITTGTYRDGDVNFTTAFDKSLFGGGALNGYTPELIAYGRTLTPLERRQVETYLAIRYGITLNGSYYTGTGNLSWDRDESAAYHHRVTGIGRDDAGDLFQPLSTTSYEEAPRYSTEKTYDSFRDADPYGLPTSQRLLVMGREDGSPMPDGGFMIWGDDNAATTTVETEGKTPWHVMNRRWLVRTNIDSTEYRKDIWTQNGITVTSDGFMDAVSQNEPKEGAYIVSSPLDTGNGTMEYTNPRLHPAYNVGFTEASGTKCAYGFNVSARGEIRIVEDGTIQNRVLTGNTGGKSFIVRRKGNSVTLLIDGRGSKELQITIPVESTAKAACMIFEIASGETALNIPKLRRNGFGDSGNMVELGYGVLAKGNKFAGADYRNVFMLIDRNAGDKTDIHENIIIRCSRKDASREKLIFDNIFMDTDGSGSDTFTFACFDGILARLTPHDASCTGGKPRKDGSLDISMVVGLPSFSYSLLADSVENMEKGAVASRGNFTTKTYTVKNLLPGNYSLLIKQNAGIDIMAESTGGVEYAHAVGRRKQGEVTWTIPSLTSDYRAGLCTTLGLGKNILHGFDVKNATAQVVVEGKPMGAAVTLNGGDALGIIFTPDTVSYTVNGIVVHRAAKKAGLGWLFGMGFNKGLSTIDGLSIDGGDFALTSVSRGVAYETKKAVEDSMAVIIGSECSPNVPKAQARSAENTSSIERQAHSALTVTRKDGTGMAFSAELRLAKETDAELLVYDTSGRLLSRTDMAGGTIKRADFTVPQTGVYVVKALTLEEEFTKKIMATY